MDDIALYTFSLFDFFSFLAGCILLKTLYTHGTTSSSVADPDLCVSGLPDPDPLVRGTDPVPDPSIIKQK